MFGTHWSLLGHRTSAFARVALITLSASIFSIDFGNRGHSAVIVCSSLWAKKPVVVRGYSSTAVHVRVVYRLDLVD